MEDLATAKIALRKLMRARRLGLSKALPKAGQMAAQLLRTGCLAPFSVLGAYWPQGSEIDPWPTVERLVQTGARLALPAALNSDSPLAFRRYAPSDDLVPDAFGIPSPPPQAQAVDPDLIICPLLAFDLRGHRLGQGAGHYDRTVAALRLRQPVFLLGLGFAGQEVDRVPTGSHDMPLDAILTENGYIDFR